jgi:hypothetical protein
MPKLTIEAIRENPWNVVTYMLPTRPMPLLLKAAYLAADYCRNGEYLLMMAARDGFYTPHGWKAASDSPDVHEEFEARGLNADRRLNEIYNLHRKRNGQAYREMMTRA